MKIGTLHVCTILKVQMMSYSNTSVDIWSLIVFSLFSGFTCGRRSQYNLLKMN